MFGGSSRSVDAFAGRGKGELPRFCSTFRIDLMAERLPKLQNSREGGEDIQRSRTGQKPMREKEKRLYKEKKEGA